jgi:hydroxypyruvate reductase
MSIQFINPDSCENSEIINAVLGASLQAVDPYQCTKKFLEFDGKTISFQKNRYEIDQIDNIYLIGTGKAVLPMALAVQDKLGERITKGFFIAKHEDPDIQRSFPENFTTVLGTHPLPSRRSEDSTKEMIDLLQGLAPNDLVICLISGGGSALMSMPYEGISIDDMQAVTRQLLFSGASINEVNSVRKHLDMVKGGGLARQIWPAKLVTLVLSDVIGDALDAIASGPTVADPTTYADAISIINRYNLAEKIPANVFAHLQNGLNGKATETVKAGEKYLLDSNIFIIGSLSIAAQAAKDKAIALGLNAAILTTDLKGEAREAGRMLVKEFSEIAAGKHALQKPACLIAGGETTVTVKGKGKGGRNQETALSAARFMQDLPGCTFISLATDGEDGPTDAAGAVVDNRTIQIGEGLGLDAEDFLERNDAYTYLEKTKSLIKIGPTGTNVNDLVFMFAFEPGQD